MKIWAGKNSSGRGYSPPFLIFETLKYICGRIAVEFVRGALAFGIMCLTARGQTNAWTGPVSGNWEDSTAWSLGILPGTNQTVMLTNAGWKAVQIESNTVRNFPQSLNVNSVTVSSPANTFNTLLMNFSGLVTPLTVTELSVASNSAMTMLSSALQIKGPAEGGMKIGGQFNQTNSVVSGNQIEVGYIGPGVYNFDSGLLNVTYLWVGGPYNGFFNQNGGTNSVGTVHLGAPGGKYVLSNGVYNAMTYFEGGTFVQEGGELDSEVYIVNGSYVLAGGILWNESVVPGTNGYSAGSGTVLQTGGTNSGPVYLGSYGPGFYTLSNGVMNGFEIAVDHGGLFTQWGGTQTVSDLEIFELQVTTNSYQIGKYILNAGTLALGSMELYGQYIQTGGSNIIDYDIYMDSADGGISQSGGLLAVPEITAYGGNSGGIFLSAGGTMVVSNQLTIIGNNTLGWQGFVMTGGQLIVSNIEVEGGASFTCDGGTVSQSGTLYLYYDTSFYAGSTSQKFGPLAAEGFENTFFMPAGASIMRFADSSSQFWFGMLTISNWNGSLTGGGKQQIIFGSSAGGLTAQQLSLIQFQNPVGFAPGNYPARILSNGEIVPVAATLAVNPQAGGIQLTLQGRAGSNYNIVASTDLLHWTELTFEFDTSGSLTIIDTNAPNFPSRYYRATLVP
jgi:hypothetical protein